MEKSLDCRLGHFVRSLVTSSTSLSGFDLLTKLCAPRRSTARRSSSTSSVENTTIFTPGTLFAISGIASRPVITGSHISVITKSGCKALAFSIASNPFLASPQTSKPQLAAWNVYSASRHRGSPQAKSCGAWKSSGLALGSGDGPEGLGRFIRVSPRGGELFWADVLYK